jgi:hypothetical protein
VLDRGSPAQATPAVGRGEHSIQLMDLLVAVVFVVVVLGNWLGQFSLLM